MDLSNVMSLFGYSIYDPQIDALFEQCDAVCEDKSKLKRYDSVESRSAPIKFWFWWKNFYREQIGTPQGLVKRGGEEVVLYELGFGSRGLEGVPLPYGLSFPATADGVAETMGRKPHSKSKNVSGDPIWEFYDDVGHLLVIFEKGGSSVRYFKICATYRNQRRKIQFLENLKGQKKNIDPARGPQIEALSHQLPTAAWEARMRDGDEPMTAAAIAAANEVFREFLDNVIKATEKKDPKSLYTSVTKATRAFNKVARQHGQAIETMEREEIVQFLHDTLRLTGFHVDPNFDLTEEYRRW